MDDIKAVKQRTSMTNIKPKALRAPLVVFATMVTASSAQAGLVGNTLQYTYFVPNLASVYVGPYTFVGGPGVELPYHYNGTGLVDNHGQMDVSDSTIQIPSVALNKGRGRCG